MHGHEYMSFDDRLTERSNKYLIYMKVIDKRSMFLIEITTGLRVVVAIPVQFHSHIINRCSTM